MTAPYRPVSCALHTELEAAALRGETVEIHAAAATGPPRVWRGRVVDVYSRAGAEYLTLATAGGERLTLRLDQVLVLTRTPPPC
jgi:Rho-binding antiterminator